MESRDEEEVELSGLSVRCGRCIDPAGWKSKNLVICKYDDEVVVIVGLCGRVCHFGRGQG